MLVYNGTAIEKVIYNGTEIDSVVYNGVEVFNASRNIVNNGVVVDYTSATKFSSYNGKVGKRNTTFNTETPYGKEYSFDLLKITNEKGYRYADINITLNAFVGGNASSEVNVCGYKITSTSGEKSGTSTVTIPIPSTFTIQMVHKIYASHIEADASAIINSVTLHN